MTRSLKAIGALVIAFAIIGITLSFFGLPRSSVASKRSSEPAYAVTISPEEMTRTATPMPVQEIENYQ